MRRIPAIGAIFALITLGASPVTVAEAAEPPPNDDFANAQPLSGADVTYSQSNVGATLQAQEPRVLAAPYGETSVWFSWSAPYTGTVTMDMCGSEEYFEGVLAAYTGSTLSSLEEIDHDHGLGCDAAIEYLAVSGTSYKISVADWDSAGGSFTLNIHLGDPVGLLSVEQHLDFGRVLDGTSKTMDLVLHNVGDGPLTIDDVRMHVYEFAAGEWEIVSDNASGHSIAAGGSRTVTIKFSPTNSDSGTMTGEGTDDYSLGELGRLIELYTYDGSIPTGTQIIHYIRNIGGRGTVDWFATTANKLQGVWVPRNTLTGTKTLLAGEYYAVGVNSPSCGQAQASYQIWGYGGWESKLVFKPFFEGGTVGCLATPVEVGFYRMGDAYVVIDTDAPIENEPPLPYVVTGFDEAAVTALLGEGQAYCPGYQDDPRNQVVGTSGKDVLVGTSGADIICGLGGRDKLLGKGGKDLIIGGAGIDKLLGGSGNDKLLARDGTKDVLKGGTGRDTGKVDKYDVTYSIERIRR